MKLFVKIFLWFLAAVGLMVGVLMFVTRTFQTEPMVGRFERSTRNQLTVYGGTGTQIIAAEGEAGLRVFLNRLKDLEPPRQVSLIAADNSIWFGDKVDTAPALDLVSRTLAAGQVETDFTGEDRTIGAAPVNFPDGRKFVLMFQWERQTPPSLFWGSTTAYARLGGILFTATLLCYLLALYLTSPIRKLRLATNKLADGDLTTRVAPLLGRRRDEIGEAAGFAHIVEHALGLFRQVGHEAKELSGGVPKLVGQPVEIRIALEVLRNAPYFRPHVRLDSRTPHHHYSGILQPFDFCFWIGVYFYY